MTKKTPKRSTNDLIDLSVAQEAQTFKVFSQLFPGCKLTQEQAWKACGQEYKPGDKKVTVEEFLPVYEAMTAEKAPGGYYDYLEG